MNHSYYISLKRAQETGRETSESLQLREVIEMTTRRNTQGICARHKNKVMFNPDKITKKSKSKSYAEIQSKAIDKRREESKKSRRKNATGNSNRKPN